MDAYDGTMTFYANDPDDPLIRAWQGVFPTLFRPMTEFPADLRPHLRVPEELFNVQTRVYGRYHVQNPTDLLSAGRPLDGADRPDVGVQPARARRTT